MCTDWKNSHNITLVTTMVIGKLRLYYNKCCFGNMVLKYSLIPMDFKMCRYQRGNFLQRILSKLRAIRTFTKYHMKMTCWIVYFMNSMERKQGNCFIHLIELQTLTMALESSIFSSIYLLFWSRNVSCCAKNRKGNKKKISSLMMKAMRRNEWYGMRTLNMLYILLTANQISS